ncbi:hypothetical protein VD0004_g1761 [Verticillium dahliae]|nr:hypothetical protein VD0004_g1761 [Verticillium dahliae]PNH75693.1 hypothetical protein VD0001_g1867 [Verticillium dahliae]
MTFNPTYATVNTEDCDIHYWYLGSGPLLVFVAGGNGHGRQFNNIMAALSNRFTCATYDRRQMSASQSPNPRLISPPQQARDLLAVMQALGHEKSTIFGSSLGGLIGLQFAHDFPERVEHLIIHETATALIMPDANEIWEWAMDFYRLKEEEGWEAASAKWDVYFGANGYDAEGVPKTVPPPRHNVANFWNNEFIVITSYLPNLHRIRKNATSIGIMRGERSGDAFFARATYALADVLECLRWDVPGHHQGFEVETEAFSPFLLNMLAALGQGQRNESSTDSLTT